MKKDITIKMPGYTLAKTKKVNIPQNNPIRLYKVSGLDGKLKHFFHLTKKQSYKQQSFERCE